MAAASLLAAFAIAVSLVVAEMVARDEDQRARSAFGATAAQVASALRVTIQHEEDFVVSARARLAGDPSPTPAAFGRWMTAVQALARYPELEGGGEVVLVPASRLPAFARRQAAAPASGLAGARSFAVVPPGSRPYYCLLALEFARWPQTLTATPAGEDYCAPGSSVRSVFLAARDTGQNAYLPYRSPAKEVLVIESPIYRGGAVPATVARRRAAFLGEFGTTIAPEVILQTALRGHGDIAVEFHFHGGGAAATYQWGSSRPGRRAVTIDLGGGWTMTAFGGAAARGTLGDSTALILLIAGVVAGMLLALLVFVLGTGRTRALLLVSEKTREISHQALHDGLTGLPNRTLVMDRAERMLARARRGGDTAPAALYVDVDRFKHVNDTFGHGAGDRLLQTVAERLRDAVREQDTVGRLGGDEFIVLLEPASGRQPPEQVAERILDALRQPVTLLPGSRPFTPTFSVGIAVGARDTADELLRDADLALYTAKASGKDRAVLFEPGMQTAAARGRRLELELDAAIEEQQFFLVYQPIVELSSRDVVGVEALIRWKHPQRGVVYPDEFIPFSEDTGQVMAIGRWVLREACSQAARWAAAGLSIGMSVNVSARQLDREELPHDIREALESSGIEPSSLTLEITETALMRDVRAAASRLHEIRELGVRVALDDVGTGSSSLAYLRAFAPDALKIDRSFITAMNGSRESAAIVRTLVELGRLLDIETLAEGIEEPEQVAELELSRCDLGQGFLFAQPLAPEELERFLAARGTGPGVRLANHR